MSKVATLVEEIMKENEKVVAIVSQWVKVLELFEKRFLKDGIKYDFIDGSVSYDDRSSMTLNFNETTDGPSVSFLFRMLSCFI
jgi:SNF2 family DNA or RNA helicase